MTIRLATRQDIPQLKQLLVRYSWASPLPQLVLDNIDDERGTDSDVHNQMNSTLTLCILSGAIFVDEHEGEFRGAIMGMKMPHLFNPRYVTLQLLCYWVEPQYRTSNTAYKLFKHYKNWADSLVEGRQIHCYTLTKNEYTSKNLSYERWNMNKLEETWISSGGRQCQQ